MTKFQLLVNDDRDVEGMSIDGLNRYLWRHFLPATFDVSSEERKRLTVRVALVCI